VSEPEVPLLGGDVTDGVVRVGRTVRRPTGPQSPLVHQVLAHLEAAGFTGAPRFLGFDEQGREILTFVDGEIAGRPWPAWVADEDRLVSVARLVRAYDDAVAAFGVPESATGVDPDPPGIPESIAGTPNLVGHLDFAPENIVFTGATATALIDFDLLRPATRVEEVGNLLLWWAPLLPAADRERALRDADPLRRTRLIVDTYGLDATDRERLVAVARNTADRAWHRMRDRAARLGGGWQRMWADGVGERILRRQDWLAENARALHAAVTRPPAGG
jgi:hypothetical protein